MRDPLRNYRLSKTCSSCRKPICDQNSKGVCRTCFIVASNRDPELNQRRGETLSKRSQPGGAHHEKRVRACAIARASRDPDKLRQRGLDLQREYSHRLLGKRGTRRHKWLPEEYRPVYFKMVRNHGYTAQEAKRIILDQIDADHRRAGLASAREIASAPTKDPAAASRRLLSAMLEMVR